MHTELKFDTVWHIVISVVLIGLGLLAGYLRFAELGRGVRSIFRPDPQDAEPAPLTPGRKVSRAVFSVLAVCCLGAAGLMVCGGFVILLGKSYQLLAIFAWLVAGGLVVLARACQRIGQERFRWW